MPIDSFDKITSKQNRESTVVYRVFFLDSPSQDNVVQKHWDYCQLLAPWLLAYPWYNEQFSLSPPKKSTSSPPCLSGSLNYGESIEDEWFVVWLLYQISNHDPNVVIQVEDEDGEFLLIEAAEFIPKWLTPENSSNRVWLWNGRMGWLEHGKPSSLGLNEALRLFAGNQTAISVILKFSESVNCAINRKIKGYPDRIKTMTHLAHVFLPYPAAALLSLPHTGHLVGAAVLALAASHYDPVGSRKLLQSNNCLFRTGYEFKESKQTDSIWSNMRKFSSDYFLRPCLFNRLQYAKLRSLPTPTGVKYPRECRSVADRMAMELGIKLCTGLDLLLLSNKLGSTSVQSSTGLSANSFSNSRWEEFQKRLEAVGYFRGELAGSRLHTQLLENARAYYQDCSSQEVLSANGDPHEQQSNDPAETLWRLLSAIENDPSMVPSVAELHKEETELPPPDDESWLFITPDELDAMLASHSGANTDNSIDSIAAKLDKFIGASSSFQGVDLSPKKSALKRRISPLTDDAVGESELSPDEEINSDDSEDGYSEQLSGIRVDTAGQSNGQSMNMGDMMRSLMSKIDDSRPSTSMVARGCQPEQAVTVTNQTRSGVTKSQLLSSSSEDDLLDLYGPGTDARLDRFDRTLQSSSDDSSLDNSNWKAPVTKQKHSQHTSQGNRDAKSLYDLLPPSFSRPVTQTADSEYSSDEEPTAKEVGWYTSSKQASTKAPPADLTNQAEKAEKFSFKEYFELMEDELSGQPVNSGRYRASGTTQPFQNGKNAGASHRKKPRHLHSSAILAQPEQFDVPEDGDHLTSDDDELSPELANLVTQHLCTSALSAGQTPHAPTGAAAQLFTALGIPVHQMAAAVSSKAPRDKPLSRDHI